jgi:hypothetical protein
MGDSSERSPLGSPCTCTVVDRWDCLPGPWWLGPVLDALCFYTRPIRYRLYNRRTELYTEETRFDFPWYTKVLPTPLKILHVLSAITAMYSTPHAFDTKQLIYIRRSFVPPSPLLLSCYSRRSFFCYSLRLPSVLHVLRDLAPCQNCIMHFYLFLLALSSFLQTSLSAPAVPYVASLRDEETQC